MNLRVFWFLFALLPITLQSQTYRYNTSNHELVYVHLDKLIYVAGEPVHYKAYLVDAENPGGMPCSKILYFTLSGAQEPTTWRINIKEKSTAGSFILPDNLKEGMYTLSAYTNWMRNGSAETFYLQKLLIVSLSRESSGSFRMLPKNQEKKVRVDAVSGSTLKVTMPKNTYKPGEMVEAEFSFPDGSPVNADVSVSVTAAHPFYDDMDEMHISDVMPLISNAPAMKPNIPACDFPIEDKGFILSGRIIKLQGANNQKPCNVWLSVADSLSSGIMYTPTDLTGHFKFYLGKRYDNKELILQLADPEQYANCRLEVFPKTVMSDTAKVTYQMDSTQYAFLKTVEDIRMIEAIYGNQTGNVPPPVDVKYLNFLRKPDKIIFPSNFSEMRNFREIASNIIPEARFSVRNDKFHLWILSPSDTWKECRIVMLNGVPFNDLAYISTLGTKDIQRIETYKSNILVGDIILPGLLCIYTYDLKIPESYLKSRTVRFNNSVLDVAENYPDEEQITSNKHYPQFRNNLYWNPFVKVSGGHASIKFPSMYLQGQFVVQVEGLTEKGIPVNASASFEIKE